MDNRFEVKFDVIQTDKYEQGLQGSFDIINHDQGVNGDFELIGVGQKDVSGSFETIIANQSEQGLKGSFTTVGAGKKGISGDFLIYPRNKFEVKFDVIPPPRIIKTLNAKKDVFVFEGNKTYNYGLWSYLQVGVDSQGLKSRSFLDFDFSTFPTNVHITKANLILYSKSRNAFEGLEISTSNKEYDETDIVWGNQPIRKEFISVNNISDGAYKISFDVTNIVKNVWYAQNYNNHGFLLKSYDETVQQVIQFFSKESVSYAPQLEIEYFDEDIYNVGAGAIQGQLEVVIPAHEQGLSGDFEVYKEKDTTSLISSFQLFNGDMINADIFVPATKDVHADFKVWIASHISGDFILQEKPTSYPEISGDLRVLHFDPDFNMYYEQIKGSLEVPDSLWLRSDFYIAQNSQINGELLVVNNQAKIYGSFNVVHISDMSGEIGNINPLNRLEIDGSFNVLGKGSTKVNGSFTTCHIKDISCDFVILEDSQSQVNASFEIPHLKDNKGSFEIKNATEISGDMLVLVDAKIDGELEVVIPAEEQGLKGSFQAIAQKSIQGEFDIKQDRLFGELTVLAQNSIHGDFFIPEKRSIKGNFVVWKQTYVQGSLEVIPLGFTDLFCGFYLDGRIPVVKSYGFIM